MTMLIKYDKIVRDNIPRIIRASGGECRTRMITSKRELTKYLITKLREETNELEKATTNSGMMEELGDIMECVFAITDNACFDIEKVMRMRKRKAERKGTFLNGVILLEASEQ